MGGDFHRADRAFTGRCRRGRRQPGCGRRLRRRGPLRFGRRFGARRGGRLRSRRNGRQRGERLQGSVSEQLHAFDLGGQVPIIQREGGGRRHQQALARLELLRRQVVGIQQVIRRQPEAPGHLGQRVALPDGVVLEVQPLAGGHAGELAQALARLARGHAQHVGARRCGTPQQLRIQGLQGVRIRTGTAGEHREAGHAGHGHRLVGVRRQRQDAQAVALGVAPDQDRGAQFGHIVLGLGAQPTGAGQIPEIPGPDVLDGALQGQGTGVVAGGSQIPVAGDLVQPLEIAGRRAGGLHRVAPLLDPGVAREAVDAACGTDELPHAHGLGVALGLVAEARFDHGQVGQILRHPFLREDLPDHRHVHRGATQGVLHEAALGGGEEAHPGEHLVVQIDGEIVGGALLCGPDPLQFRPQFLAADGHHLAGGLEAGLGLGGLFLGELVLDLLQPLQKALHIGVPQQFRRPVRREDICLVGTIGRRRFVFGLQGLLRRFHEAPEARDAGRVGFRRPGRSDRHMRLGGRRRQLHRHRPPEEGGQKRQRHGSSGSRHSPGLHRRPRPEDRPPDRPSA